MSECSSLINPIPLTHLKVSIFLGWFYYKFYCQHYSKGIMCLGTMLKRNRKYIKNTNFENIIKRIRQLRKCKPETQLASLNSYSGMFKDKQQFVRLSKVITKVNTFLSNLKWSATRKCFQLIGDYNAYCY